MVNVVYSLFNFIVFSFLGCFKVIDDGVEFVVENLRKLRSFDFFWCSRIIDMVLEYVVCDLYRLEEFVLDRCARFSFFGFVGRGWLDFLSREFRLVDRFVFRMWLCMGWGES